VTTQKILVATLALLMGLALAPLAAADEKLPVVVWPTLEPAGDGPSSAPLHKPQPAPDKSLFERAQELDATLRDAVQDLGFTLYVADAGPAPGRTRDEDLVNRAARSAAGDALEGGTWVVSPRIESAGGGAYVVRVVAVAPRARELRVRVETVSADSVSARGLVMLRDLLSPEAASRAAVEQEREQAAKGSAQGITTPLRSQGRALLAVSSGLFGAYTAYSLQRASGSDDPRVLYPLLALGTGIGIGAALLVADEWDVTNGDAGFLSAGALWGTAAASLIAAGSNVQPFENRYGWSVGGGLLGMTLATVAITQTPMDDGDATLAHSGGVVGLLAGGAIEYLYRGTTANVTPYRGMGLGTAIGTVAAGAHRCWRRRRSPHWRRGSQSAHHRGIPQRDGGAHARMAFGDDRRQRRRRRRGVLAHARLAHGSGPGSSRNAQRGDHRREPDEDGRYPGVWGLVGGRPLTPATCDLPRAHVGSALQAGRASCSRTKGTRASFTFAGCSSALRCPAPSMRTRRAPAMCSTIRRE